MRRTCFSCRKLQKNCHGRRSALIWKNGAGNLARSNLKRYKIQNEAEQGVRMTRQWRAEKSYKLKRPLLCRSGNNFRRTLRFQFSNWAFFFPDSNMSSCASFFRVQRVEFDAFSLVIVQCFEQKRSASLHCLAYPFPSLKTYFSRIA